MSTRNEQFVLAKLNVLENVTAEIIVAITVAMPAPDWPAHLHANMRESMRLRGSIKQGDPTAGDPLELQTEMLKQLDYFFGMVKHYQTESGTPKTSA